MVFLALAVCCSRFWCSTKMLNHWCCGYAGLSAGRTLRKGGWYEDGDHDAPLTAREMMHRVAVQDRQNTKESLCGIIQGCDTFQHPLSSTWGREADQSELVLQVHIDSRPWDER